MQNGATPQAANTTLEPLEQKFGDRVISQRIGNPCKAHSPNLNPFDFFPWGYIEDNVHGSNPTTLQDLKTSITRFIRAIFADMYKKVIGNFAVRLNECVNRCSAHINYILWMSKKLLQTEEKLEMNTRDKIVICFKITYGRCQYPKGYIFFMVLFLCVFWDTLKYINTKNFRFSKFKTFSSLNSDSVCSSILKEIQKIFFVNIAIPLVIWYLHC